MAIINYVIRAFSANELCILDELLSKYNEKENSAEVNKLMEVIHRAAKYSQSLNHKPIITKPEK